MNTKVFAYCERGSDPGFWAEPANAITNGAFFIAALLALWLWLSQPAGRRGAAELALIAIVFVIGTGSFLFHTLATRWAAIADTVPIGIFMVSYLGYALRRYFGWSWLATLAALALFFVSLWQSSVVRCGGGPCLNGSVAYGPAFLAMVLIGGVLLSRGHSAGRYVLAAGLTFAVSLTFRSIDRLICTETALTVGGPIGTHFAWHLLNAALLYLLLRAAILHGARETVAREPA